MYHDEEFKELFILAFHKQGIPINEIIHTLLRKAKGKKESEAYQKKINQMREYIEKLIEFDNENDWFERVKKRKHPSASNFG